MRMILIASAGVALTMASGADAQAVAGRGSGMGTHVAPGVGYRPTPTLPAGHSRWGSNVDGRWWGGANAPGGWAAYRRPYRGWGLPSYWNSPRFYVTGWNGYGLAQPPVGYNWVRYYDDAVLVDSRGSIYDTDMGIDWDRADAGYYTDDAQVYASPADRGYGRYDARADAPPPPPPAPSSYGATYGRPGEVATYRTPRYEQRSTSSGVTGAVVGGVAGGVAGNAIAGRGDRLGGTLIGAGVGAAAGYAVDRAANTRSVPVAPPAPDAGYGASYGMPEYGRGARVPVAPRRAPPPPPGYADGADYAPPPPVPPRGGNWTSADGRTTVVTTGGGYAGGYGGGSTTTVVVQSQPVVTTTTTETWEDAVTYSRPKARRVYRGKTKLRCRAAACNCR